jgi:hypothetical protein
METLYLDDYFDARELNDFLYSYGWEMEKREWSAVSTLITISPLSDSYPLDELVVRMSDIFFVQVKVV